MEEGCGVMARRDELLEALDAIETGMCRIKESRGIWQNDLVYALCQGVRMLLMEKLRHGIPVEASSPAADVAPVVHGRWNIMDGYKMRRPCSVGGYKMRRACSVCGWDVSEYGKFYRYCPNCGAKMDGGDHQ